MKRQTILFVAWTVCANVIWAQTVKSEQSHSSDTFPTFRIEAERLPDMNLPRAGHSVFITDGELTVVGGHTSGFVLTPTAEYFSDGQWHLLPTVYPHDNGLAVVLQQGRKALIAGGHEKNLGIGQSYEVEMYDRTAHTFVGFGCLDKKRAFLQGLEMDSGRVLISGNHKGNDALEMFDGQKYFNHVKDVASWHFTPYLIRTAKDDAIVFGTVWRNGRAEPCDTVDCLKGDPFTVPLLKTWMPMVFDQSNHAECAFIGDEATGDYSYLIAAKNHDGEIAFIRIKGTDFSLLKTSCPVPTSSRWGAIKFNRAVVADRHSSRAYLFGCDSTGRAYVVSVEYNKTPAPLTLYYTDPLNRLGDTTPVLMPDGDLVVTGGILDDNFAPLATVWLFHLQTTATTSQSTGSMRLWLWMVLAVLAIVAALAIVRYRVHCPPTRQSSVSLPAEPIPEPATTGHSNRNADPNPGQESVYVPQLQTAISQLIETQRLYLNPDLKVTDVADALGVHRNAVSACINAWKGYSFNKFLNDYRVEHAKQILHQNPDQKIAAVALESGFSNERSFFRAFKAVTGLTPKEWVTQQKN